MSIAAASVTEQRYDGDVMIERACASGHVTWFPRHPVGKEFGDVPEGIGAVASEAYECASISAFRGALMLARAAIEATAKDKGITEGSLFKKIEALGTEGILRPHIVETAHAVRDFGNSTAHSDDDLVVEEADALLILSLMDEVLNEVYQSPAKLAKVMALRGRGTPTT